MSATRPFILIGAGGHAKVILAALRACALPVAGVVDPTLNEQGVSHWRGLEVLGDDDALRGMDPAAVSLANGIGQLPRGPAIRAQLFDVFSAMGFVFPPIVHPHALVDQTVVLEAGAQVMAGVVVQADTHIGENTLVNTGARIDHDCRIGRHCHIAPGAVLCGSVTISDSTFVGAGSVVVQNVKLGRHSVLGAGGVLVRDLADDSVVLPQRNRLMQNT